MLWGRYSAVRVQEEVPMSRLQQTEGLTDIQEEILKTVRAFV